MIVIVVQRNAGDKTNRGSKRTLTQDALSARTDRDYSAPCGISLGPACLSISTHDRRISARPLWLESSIPRSAAEQDD